MASNSRSQMSKAERQAETGRLIAEARKAQEENAGQKLYDEDDMDDILGSIPDKIKPAKVVKEGKSPVMNRVRTHSGEMVTFYTKKGQRITGPAVRYWVVQFGGRLHYKQENSVTLLPDDWKEGDALTEKSLINLEDDLI